MKRISSKKCFFYGSLIGLLIYSLFVLIAYNSNVLPALYDVKTSSTYYLFSYLILSAVLYAIDTHTRKEPAFLTLFCLPAFTCIYLFLTLFSVGYNYKFYLVVILVVGLIYIASAIINKYYLSKILVKENRYANVLFIYVIFHLMLALYLSFKFLGYM